MPTCFRSLGEPHLDLAAAGLLDLDLPRGAAAVVTLHANRLATAGELDRGRLRAIRIRAADLLLRVAAHCLCEAHASGAEGENHGSTDE